MLVLPVSVDCKAALRLAAHACTHGAPILADVASSVPLLQQSLFSVILVRFDLAAM